MILIDADAGAIAPIDSKRQRKEGEEETRRLTIRRTPQIASSS
jgi:hypothetical protein